MTINTGVPGSVGSLLSGAVENVNNALAGFKDVLTDLKAQIATTLESAVETVRTTVTEQVEAIVTAIKDNILASAEAAKSAADSALSDASDALDADSAGVGSAIATKIDDVVFQPIKSLVGDGPIASMLEALILDPIKKLLTGAIDSGLGDAITKIVNRVGATLSSSIDAAAGKAIDAVDAAVRDIINPQLNRIYAQLDALSLQLQNLIAPIFGKLESIADIRIGPNFGELQNVEVEVTAIGIGNATAFVGLAPDVDEDGEIDFVSGVSLAEQNLDNATGLLIENFTMGLGIFKPIAGDTLPTFTAVKIGSI